jgi:hypothetical protein
VFTVNFFLPCQIKDCNVITFSSSKLFALYHVESIAYVEVALFCTMDCNADCDCSCTDLH